MTISIEQKFENEAQSSVEITATFQFVGVVLRAASSTVMLTNDSVDIMNLTPIFA
jgi:hypothetical protein